MQILSLNNYTDFSFGQAITLILFDNVTLTDI